MDVGSNPVRYGRYLLLDRINVGGMAEVFRGKSAGVEGFERIVALKRILPNIAADPDFVQMFVEEAKLVVQLQHANIAQVYDLGKAEGTYYIAMEYVSGTDLRSMWDRARGRNRLLPIAMSCYIMQRVCEGLDAAHRKKDNEGHDISLVHRDVSPQNILISYEGEVKLIDFGIARAANRVSKTQAGVLKGKFGYMSPEQVRGIELDNRSDIFACGVVLYELLVGDRLFLGESDFSTLEKVRNVEMVPPTRLNKNLSPHLERIVMKALARNREDRYRWANEMAEDLQRYLFATNQPFARTDLQRYMQQHFRSEIAQEAERIEGYKQVSMPQFEDEPPTQEHAMLPGLQMPTGTMPALALQNEPMPAPPRFPSAFEHPMAVREMSTFGYGPGAGSDAMSNPTTGTILPPPSSPPPRQSLPAWAAVLIGALTVLVLLSAGLMIYQTMAGRSSGTGVVVVTTQPAEVRLSLNGQLITNRTPFTFDDLRVGTHVLQAEADGYETKVRALQVAAGDHQTVTMELVRRPGTASVIIQTRPAGLRVWVNGEDTGLVTPATVSGLYEGEQIILLRRDDGSLAHRFGVSLTPGAAKVESIEIRSLPVRLDVVTDPPGAEIIVEGERRGMTPTTLENLSAGPLTVRLRKEGCAPATRRVRLRRATVTELRAQLRCKGGDRPAELGSGG